LFKDTENRGYCFEFADKYITCRHLQRFWGASGDYWQRNWEYIYDLFDGDEMSLALWGMSLLSLQIFCLSGCILPAQFVTILTNLKFSYLRAIIVNFYKSVHNYMITALKNMPVQMCLMLLH